MPNRDEPTQLSQEAWSVLNEIVDPCSVTAGAAAGLVDMGLVRSVEFQTLPSGGFRALVQISITHPFCMMAGVFLNEVRARLLTIAGIEEVDATVDGDTMWTPQLMTAEYRLRLREALQPIAPSRAAPRLSSSGGGLPEPSKS